MRERSNKSYASPQDHVNRRPATDSQRLGGWTALGLLCGEKVPSRKEAIRLLVGLRADLEARLPSGATPLLGAAGCGFLEAAQLLVESGADIGATDNLGRHLYLQP